jgi:DNA-binding Xre family transcriptional regulator
VGGDNLNIDIEKLDIFAAQACMSFDGLAAKSGISTVTLSRLRRGKQEPRPHTVGKIAKALNVNVEDLLKQ